MKTSPFNMCVIIHKYLFLAIATEKVCCRYIYIYIYIYIYDNPDNYITLICYGML